MSDQEYFRDEPQICVQMFIKKLPKETRKVGAEGREQRAGRR
jgi:hypothetical protein